MRQPRANTARGGLSVALGASDPRLRTNAQATVRGNVIRSRILQRLAELPDGATHEDVVQAVNQIVRVARGEEVK